MDHQNIHVDISLLYFDYESLEVFHAHFGSMLAGWEPLLYINDMKTVIMRETDKL